jgi:hypothetical protein
MLFRFWPKSIPPLIRSLVVRGTVEALQADLGVGLVHYDTKRPHLGHRNMGRRPVGYVTSFVSQEA